MKGHVENTRFHLRPVLCRATEPQMKLSLVLPLMAFVLLPSCGPDEEVVVTGTRRTTLRDVAPRLNASSDQRFRNTRPSPMMAPTPAGWLPVPANEFRLLNYRFASAGEVWVSVAGGGLLENLNRWLGQFGLDGIDQQALSSWGRVPVGADDQQGVWVEAQGTYTPGMGQEPRSEHALAGILIEVSGGLTTIKMIGPAAEVEAEKQALKAFAASMRWKKD